MKAKYIDFLEESKVKLLTTTKSITAYGGFYAIAKLFEKIKFKENIERIIPIEEKSNNSKGVFSKILLLCLTALIGGFRFSHSLFLGDSQEIYKKLFNVEKIPKSISAITRFFLQFDCLKINQELSDNLWRYTFDKIIPFARLKEDYLTFDSTVITRYGNQEGAKKGYNPKKKGRKSHHPLLAFLNKARYIVNIWNRPGNTHTSNNIINFIKETRYRLNNKIKFLGIIADTGFYDIGLIEYLESIFMNYVIATPISRTFQRQIESIIDWEKVDEDIYVAEFYFEHDDEKWTKPRRYIAVKQRVTENKEPSGKQLSLFSEDTEISGYRFGLYITTFEEAPVSIWRKYRLRADDENRIKENKNDFGLEGFCLDSFYATEACMLVRTLLYNIIHLFRTTILSKAERNQTFQTIRNKYLIIPALFGTSGRYGILRLGIKNKIKKGKFKSILSRINSYFSNIHPIALRLEGQNM